MASLDERILLKIQAGEAATGPATSLAVSKLALLNQMRPEYMTSNPIASVIRVLTTMSAITEEGFSLLSEFSGAFDDVFLVSMM